MCLLLIISSQNGSQMDGGHHPILKAVCPVALAASSPVTKSPESEGPQDSKGSLPVTDSPAPQPDPDAWIQVEKRHRQTKVPMPAVILSCSSRILRSLCSPDVSCSPSLCFHLSPVSVLVMTCVFSAPLLPQLSKLTSSLQLSTSYSHDCPFHPLSCLIILPFLKNHL